MLAPNPVYENRRKACELLRTTTVKQARYGHDLIFDQNMMCALEILCKHFGRSYHLQLGLNLAVRARIVTLNDCEDKSFSEIADYIETLDDNANKIHNTPNN